MKSRCVATLLCVLFLCLGLSHAAQEKPIRLRNELIHPANGNSLQGRPAGAPKTDSGLHLIQFTNRFQPAWAAELRAHGVQLLQYVPEDAFIARFDNVDTAAVRRLPFVHWVGKYRADHKLHASVAQRAAQKRAGELSNVSILVSPAATPAEIAETTRLLAVTRQQSKLRFGTILRGSIPSAQLDALANSEAVLWIEREFRPKLVDEIASKIVAGDDSPNVTVMEALGFDGTGVNVAVADSGLHTGQAATMHPDLAGRANQFFYYGALTDASDEHGHGTHVSGIIAGNGATGETDESGALYGLGVAPNANIIAQRIFDADGNFEAPSSFEILTHDAVRAGADIGSNSWGDDTQGRYDLSAAEFDALVRDADAETPGDQAYILEFSAGNAGPGSQTVGSPAVAKNVIATGASQNDRPDFFLYADGIDAMADFSSRGPCEDGRIKPDVVAPGTWISSLRSVLGNDDFAWAVISDNYIYEGGTSQAGPHVSGAAAVFVHYYRLTYGGQTPSPALVKAALINSAVDMDNSVETGPVPNMDEGWGRIDLTQLIGSGTPYQFLDQSQRLTTGQTYEQHLIVASPGEPLRITMAYTDVPGFPGAIPSLVNDLDLEVVAPDGQIFLGNQFVEGESISSSSTPDSINNVEAVYLSAPDPGEYIVRVRARNVVQDARSDSPEVDQDFALVLSGDFPAPGIATLILDRVAYRAPGDIRIKLFDTALAGQTTVTVVAHSTTEATGPSILLRASSSGIFTGQVATASGPAVADGVLQINNQDQINVSFVDPVSHQTRTATAVADFDPPLISAVSVTNRFGRTVISWQTDEPTTAIVRFGTNSTLNFAQTNLFLENSHAVALDNLRPRTTYYFTVTSTDAAGNSTTTNNFGQPYTFTTVAPATVLLVNEFVDDGYADLPLTTYTDPLNAAGVSYDVLDIQAGDPTPGTNNLRPYRVVIWRLSDSVGTYPSTLTGGEELVIRQYLAGGGAFFFASMEHLSRLSASFVHDVLHVQSFDEDVGVPEILGIDNNPISGGVDAVLDYTAWDNDLIEFLGLSPDLSDTITPTSDAAPLFLAADSHGIAGLTYPRTGQSSTGRVAFLSFPLDVVPESGTAPNTRPALLRKILDFLAPGQNGIGTLAFDSPSYTLPSQVTVEVADSDLAGSGQVLVQVYSDSVTNRISLTLNEGIPEGVFRGGITLAGYTNPPAANRLRARSGDSIHAEYFDASRSVTIQSTSSIDIVPPTISNILVEPDYVEALATWNTSEPADALLLFGESVLLGRSAYSPDFDTSHEVVISGLLPDRIYYYQVVSHDVAGNSVVDDNNGQLYSFRTLRSIVPPFSDNFDGGAGDWQIFSSDETQTSWTLGVPNNLVQSQANSPPDAWGSSINGASLDTIDTFLISPPIDLTFGNSASVTFSASYDFSSRSEFDIYEQGQLLIITNNASDPVMIAEYTDADPDWHPEEVDLTPYLGNVVSLVWYHSLLSFESAPRPGWLVDDIAITVTNLPSGTIVVSNNLAQANFTLRGGAITRSGRGFTVLTNVALNEFVITFAPVPYYQTPPAQTNMLAVAPPLVFKGNYTFTDANSNGISDIWEQQNFGAVSPSRTRLTDTDGDGATDYAEFIAGTNPNSTNSVLRFVPPAVLSDGSIRLEWNSVAGRIYRVMGSTNAVTWTPLTDWIQASSNPTIFTRPQFSPGAPYLFRLEVRP